MGRTDSKISEGLTQKHDKKRTELKIWKDWLKKKVKTNLKIYEGLTWKIRRTTKKCEVLTFKMGRAGSKYRRPESKQEGVIDTSKPL